MLTAMMTVANMRGASHDVWSVNTDYEYHEEQRIDPTESANGIRNTGTAGGGGGPGSNGGGGGGGGAGNLPAPARRASGPSMRASVGA